MRIALGFFAILLALSSSAIAGQSGVTYQGRILKPDGSPLAGQFTQFRMQIRTPNTNDCLMYEEIQTFDMRLTSGAFSLTMADGSGSRTDSTGLGLNRIFENRGSFAFSPATCTSGSSYTPSDGDGRNLIVLFKDETMATWEPIPPQKINYVPYAFSAQSVQGFGADSMLRVVNGSGDPITGLTPLSNAQYNALLDLLSGTSAQYTRAGQLNGVALPTMNSGEVLGWNGSAWVSQSASGGPNSVTTTMIQNGAVDGTKLDPAISISTSGTIASAITTTRDFKIYAPSPSTFYVGMLADPALAASYTLTWPLTKGTNGQVLTSDGSGKLTWTSPSSAGITDLTGDVTATGPGSVAATVATVGTSTAANIHSAEVLANAATDANTPSTIVKRDASGNFSAGAISAESLSSSSTITATGAINGASVAVTGAVTAGSVSSSGPVTGTNITASGTLTATTVKTDTLQLNNAGSVVNVVNPTGAAYALTLPANTGTNGQVLTTNGSGVTSWVSPLTSSTAFVQGGNTFGVNADLGTNDAYDLNLRTSGTTKMTVTSGGKVGIGTTSPSSPLHIISATAAQTLAVQRSNNTTGASTIAYWPAGANSPSNVTWISGMPVNSNDYRIVYTPDAGSTFSYPFNITNTGNVGIGTTSPTAKLHVAGPMRLEASSLPGSPNVGDIVIDAGDGNKMKYYDGAWKTLGTGGGSGDFMKDGSVDMTGPFKASSGSSSAPSITFASDPDSGFYSYTGNAIGVATGGNVRFRFTNGGIVSETGGAFAITNGSSAANPTYTFVNNNDTGMFRATTDTLGFTTGGTEKMRITASGDVGIGTTSPGYKLDVNGTVNATALKINGVDVSTGGGDFMKDGSVAMTGPLKITNGSASAPSIALASDTDTGIFSNGTADISFTSNGTEAFRILGSSSAYLSNGILRAASGSTASPAISFENNIKSGLYSPPGFTLGLVANNIEAMRIDSSGNIGIGTTSPNGKLDVKGSLVLSGATSGYTGFQPAAAAGSTVWTLPSADGTSGQVLKTDGSGTLSWVSVSDTLSGLSCSSGQVPSWNGSAWVCVSTSVSNSNNTLVLRDGSGNVGANVVTANGLSLSNGASSTITLTTPAAFASYALQLPSTYGTNGQVLTSDGAGNASWTTPGGGSLWTAHSPNISYDGGGNVGIGTTNPGVLLDIRRTTTTASDSPQMLVVNPSGSQGDGSTTFVRSIIESHAGGNSLQMISSFDTGGTYGNRNWFYSNTDLAYYVGAGERVRFTSSGNVGIGTTSPWRALEVSRANTSGSGVVASFENTHTNANAAYGVIHASRSLSSATQPAAGFGSGLVFNLENNSDGFYSEAASIYGTWEQNQTSSAFRYGALTFYTLDPSQTNAGPLYPTTERMRITSAGKVGIGTTSPAYKLDVAGDVNVTGNFKVNGVNISGGSSPTITTKSADFTIGTGEDNYVYLVSGLTTATLPPVASVAPGFRATVKRVGANNVVLDGDGSETIDGAATRLLMTNYSSISVVNTGSAWVIVAGGGTGSGGGCVPGSQVYSTTGIYALSVSSGQAAACTYTVTVKGAGGGGAGGGAGGGIQFTYTAPAAGSFNILVGGSTISMAAGYGGGGYGVGNSYGGGGASAVKFDTTLLSISGGGGGHSGNVAYGGGYGGSANGAGGQGLADAGYPQQGGLGGNANVGGTGGTNTPSVGGNGGSSSGNGTVGYNTGGAGGTAVAAYSISGGGGGCNSTLDGGGGGGGYGGGGGGAGSTTNGGGGGGGGGYLNSGSVNSFSVISGSPAQTDGQVVVEWN